MKEIFNHPWVLEFEKQFKEEKIKNVTKAESSNTSAFNSTSNSSSNANKLVDPIKNESASDINKSKLCDVNEKNKFNPKADIKSISEKIEEKLNNKFKESKSIFYEPEKADLTDLDEIENKLNISLNKNKEYLNQNKTELATEINRKRSKFYFIRLIISL